MEHDPEVQDLIRRWNPPEAPTDADERMMARFAARRRPWWNRRLEFRVSIPVSAVSALVVALLAVGLWWGLKVQAQSEFRARMGGLELVEAPTLIVTRSEVAQ